VPIDNRESFAVGPSDEFDCPLGIRRGTVACKLSKSVQPEKLISFYSGSIIQPETHFLFRPDLSTGLWHRLLLDSGYHGPQSKNTYSLIQTTFTNQNFRMTRSPIKKESIFGVELSI